MRLSSRPGVALFFLFQAEGGIRDATVTGVQTCALPIFRRAGGHRQLAVPGPAAGGAGPARRAGAGAVRAVAEIGRASCRERGEVSVVAGSVKQREAWGSRSGGV